MNKILLIGIVLTVMLCDLFLFRKKEEEEEKTGFKKWFSPQYILRGALALVVVIGSFGIR